MSTEAEGRVQLPVVISNSSIQTFKSCRRQYWLKYYRRLKPKSEAQIGPLALGSRVHLALEQWYALRLENPGVDIGVGKLLEIWAELVEDDRLLVIATGGFLDDFNKEVELGRIMLEGYVQWIEEEGIDSLYEVIGLEETLEYPILDGEVLVVGKVDQRLRRTADNTLHIRDFKPLLLSERVATPDGWTPIGDLQVGDQVLDENFSPVTVSGVFDKGEDDVYKVSFNDNSSVIATADHPWWARSNQGGSFKVVETSMLKSGTSCHIVPTVTPADGVIKEYGISPYVLGAWIGDGARYAGRGRGACWTLKEDSDRLWRVKIGVSEKEVAEQLSAMTASSVKVISPSPGRSYKTDFYSVEAPIGIELEALGLHDKKSMDRFIPSTFMRGSKSQRLELLRGLMDTDGSVNTHSNSVAYNTTSEQLAKDVADLVRSLGGWAKPTKAKMPAKYRINGGDYKETGTYAWRVAIRLDMLPFGFHTKRILRWHEAQAAIAAQTRGAKSKNKRVVSVEPAGRGQVRCISLESSSHLFITEGTTITHNTAAAFADLMKTIEMQEQFLLYMTLEQLLKADSERVAGAVVTALRKVKRTAASKPPYYTQVEVEHNVFTLRNFFKRLIGECTLILDMHKQLDNGVDHQMIAFPSPGRDCSWRCEFAAGCAMFDNGGAVEDWLVDNFQYSDPYEYYGESSPIAKLESKKEGS